MVKSERADLMPVTEEVIAGLTHRLIVAEQRRVPIEPITSPYPALTEADAYRVQMAVVATKVEHGDRVIGRKVGATSQAIFIELRQREVRRFHHPHTWVTKPPGNTPKPSRWHHG